jgi:enoyl-[acyl-carrier protein] reductase II
MNRITELFKIKYPIIQGGMIWCSGWELASSVSNAGGLGLIGSGSMTPDILKTQIQKCKAATDKPFGVNIPLIFKYAEDFIQIVIEQKVPIVFTSAGNPMKWTSTLHEHNIKVAHVIANSKSAKKCEEAKCDAVVAEGFEAGGHNGKEETTTMVLIPFICQTVSIPVIAAGGIACGKTMLAAFSLGAEGVQIGSRFVASTESSAHFDFKQKIIQANEGDTYLAFKKLMAVRLLNNEFSQKVLELENKGASKQELSEFLSNGRARIGMFEGDLKEGELEIGQISTLINDIKPSKVIIDEIINEYNFLVNNLKPI